MLIPVTVTIETVVDTSRMGDGTPQGAATSFANFIASLLVPFTPNQLNVSGAPIVNTAKENKSDN